jgi:hypothetical protein
MHTAQDIRNFGLTKLAQDVPPDATMLDPHVFGQIVSAPSKAIDVATTGTFSAPTPQEADAMNAYMRSAIVGGATGTAISAILAAITKRSIPRHMAVGLGSGILSGIARQYDQASDPPGLSPVYTIPSGLRLGGLTGALSGAALGRLTGAGVIPGLLSGGLSGAVSGRAVSSFI